MENFNPTIPVIASNRDLKTAKSVAEQFFLENELCAVWMRTETFLKRATVQT